MRDFSEDLADLARRVREAHQYLGIDEARSRLAALETEVSAPELWDDPDRARKVNGEFAAVRDDVELVEAAAAQKTATHVPTIHPEPVISPRSLCPLSSFTTVKPSET